MRLFGAHFQGATGSSIESAHRSNAVAVKVMDSASGPVDDLIRRDVPGAYVILRKWYSPDEQAAMRAEGPSTADRLVIEVRQQFDAIIAKCRAARVPVYIEGFNEPDPNPHPDLSRLSDWYERFAYVAGAVRLLPLAYSFGTGNPPSYGWGPGYPWATYPESLARMWLTLLPGLRACVDAGGGLALHAYDWPNTLTDPYWQGLRFLNDFDAIAANDEELAAATDLFLTEWGIDVGIKPEYVAAYGERKGWRTALHNDGEEFAQQTLAYEKAVLESRWGHRVRGIFTFTIASDWMWTDYSPEGVGEYERAVALELGGETMPENTIITALNRPHGKPGDTVRFQFHAEGVDGLNKTIADVSYPPLPDDPESTYGPNQTTTLDAFRNGDHTVGIQLPPVTTPLPAGGVVASIMFRFFETDGTETDGGIRGPFAVDIHAEAQQPPSSPVQPPGSGFATPEIQAHYDAVYAEIIALEADPDHTAADQKFKDDVLELIKWRKGERAYPFR